LTDPDLNNAAVTLKLKLRRKENICRLKMETLVVRLDREIDVGSLDSGGELEYHFSGEMKNTFSFCYGTTSSTHEAPRESVDLASRDSTF
jgi:hypothetical protein